MPESKSTDKLQIVMQGVNDKVFTDPDLKSRITKLNLTWDAKQGVNENIVVPNFSLEFRE